MKKKKFAIIALAALLVPSVAARQPQRGYRGFVDAEWSRYSRRLTDYGGWHENHWGVSTVHGYQVMPQLFVGAGAALNRNAWLGSWYPRLFADVRTDLKFGIFTPFADLRAGWTLTSDAGFYFSPTVGYRFNRAVSSASTSAQASLSSPSNTTTAITMTPGTTPSAASSTQAISRRTPSVRQNAPSPCGWDSIFSYPKQVSIPV